MHHKYRCSSLAASVARTSVGNRFGVDVRWFVARSTAAISAASAAFLRFAFFSLITLSVSNRWATTYRSACSRSALSCSTAFCLLLTVETSSGASLSLSLDNVGSVGFSTEFVADRVTGIREGASA